MTQRRVIGVVLLASAAWGVWTVVNAIRLGARDSDPALYWVSVTLIGLLSVAVAWIAARLLRTPTATRQASHF